MERIILASASPRRAELLRAAGIAFDVVPADADERVHPGEAPEAYVRRVAGAKALAVIARASGRPVLAADTVVVVDGAILGKPVDREDAGRMLRMLSGRAHEVITAVTLVRGPAGSAPQPVTMVSGADPVPCGADPSGPRVPGTSRAALTGIDTTTVEFSTLGEDDIAWYTGTGEPDDKAGAYAIQGLGSRFVTRISGSYSNVVGLPVSLVFQMFRGAGLRP